MLFNYYGHLSLLPARPRAPNNPELVVKGCREASRCVFVADRPQLSDCAYGSKQVLSALGIRADGGLVWQRLEEVATVACRTCTPRLGPCFALAAAPGDLMRHDTATPLESVHRQTYAFDLHTPVLLRRFPRNGALCMAEQARCAYMPWLTLGRHGATRTSYAPASLGIIHNISPPNEQLT
jgi:hypothetical protein